MFFWMVIILNYGCFLNKNLTTERRGCPVFGTVVKHGPADPENPKPGFFQVPQQEYSTI